MENKKERIRKLKQELLVSKTLNIKLNYSDLSRKYKIDRRTIKKYNNGYETKVTRERKSKLDDFKDIVKEKLELSGATIIGVYQYISSKHEIGSYSNFHKYVIKNNLKPKKTQKPNLRFETDYGVKLQFDLKEDIKNGKQTW